MRRKKDIPRLLWFILPALVGLIHFLRKEYNNYAIYKGVFYHLIKETNLYSLYPAEYFDTNHYGPLFALIIMPFSVLPDYLGLVLWTTFHAFVLYKAITTLPIKEANFWIVILICLVDLMTSSHNLQVNPSVGALIILSWYFVRKEKDFWAPLFVMIGAFVKLYGIVGLAFWLFSKHKFKYIYSAVFWAAVLFVLPMLISSPSFVVQSYSDWYHSLVEKNLSNQTGSSGIGNMQDVSLMGLVRRLGGFELSNLVFIVPGLLLQLAPLVRFSLYNNLVFQLRYLASILIFVVIFSSSSESSTFIVATSGVAIWFITQEYPVKRWVWALLILVLVGTSLSATDIFPYHVRQMFINYSIKAFPCCVVWFTCIYQLLKDKHSLQDKKWILQD
ncbi:glycosyltransferase family 87 protein [Emticicia sp. 17c]|uniref:glycosyltransferase family 87 protein n=1 Tax=Emticicia sp. 17c TaxID=3127704 RepID=UPI00301CD051